ncbi:MAG: hypothetical protein OHK0017_09140 [Patescibacteria group bacterium]
MAIASYSNLFTYFILATYPKFNLAKHNKIVDQYWSENKEPSVAVFLPVCDEDIRVIEATWQGVKAINYSNYKVYVLDDGTNSRIKSMADQYGFNYLHRPNRGEFKKAGNLRFGYDNSEGELVLILDADFVPNKDILREMVPYFQDKELAIMQSPQYFPLDNNILTESNIKYGAAKVVTEFYKYVQPSRNRYGAAICVGTNALYRRKAVEEAGGPPQVDKSEDVRQGLKVINQGYKILFTPLILAIGVCPDNIQSYYKQHNRWSSGAVEMLFSSDYLQSKLTFVQRLIYSLNIAYYFREGSALVITSILYILLAFHAESLRLQYAFIFLPHVFYKFLVLNANLGIRQRIASTVTGLSHVYTYFYSLFMKLLGVTHAWTPTNKNIQGFADGYIAMSMINFGYLYLSIVATVFIFGSNPKLIEYSGTWIVLFWIVLSLIAHSASAVTNINFIFRNLWKQREEGLVSHSYFRRWQLQAISSVLVGVILLFGLTGIAFTQRTPTAVAGVSEVSQVEKEITENTDQNKDETKSDDKQSDDKKETSTEPNIKPEVPRQVIPVIENKNEQEVENNTTIINQPKVPTTYKFVVKKGNSLALFMRQAVAQYEKDSNTKIENFSKLYIETKYINSVSPDKRDLSIGSEISISTAEVKKLLEESQNLTSAQKLAWVKLSRKVNFEARN